MDIADIQIMDYSEAAHATGVRECIITLQDHEHAIDTRLPIGADIVDAYLPQMMHRCRQSDGKVFVAEQQGQVAGFITILSKVSSGEIHDGDREYALVSDLVVQPEFRRQGLAQKLLDAAEQYALAKNVKSIQIGVLTGNTAAEELYAENGYRMLFAELEKQL